VQVPAQQGGAGGKVWPLAVDRCSAELKAKLGAVEGPFEAHVQCADAALPADWQWEAQADRLRIIAPILETARYSAARAEAFKRVAGQLHVMRGKPVRIAENTLRDWVRA